MVEVADSTAAEDSAAATMEAEPMAASTEGLRERIGAGEATRTAAGPTQADTVWRLRPGMFAEEQPTDRARLSTDRRIFHRRQIAGSRQTIPAAASTARWGGPDSAERRARAGRARTDFPAERRAEIRDRTSRQTETGDGITLPAARLE